MEHYLISARRFEEIRELTDHFERIEEFLERSMTQTDELKNDLKVAYKFAKEVKSVIYDEPLTDTEETAMEKLVRTSGLSPEELNRIVGGE